MSPVIDPNVYEDIISRDAAAPISEHLFAVIVANQIVLASGGGDIDGVTVNDVAVAGRSCSIFTEGAVPVKVGAAGVTADHDVMVEVGTGMAVNATFGNKAVARSQETVASGGEARCLLRDRPFLPYGGGSGVGAEKFVAIPLDGTALHAGVVGLVNPEGADVIITRRLAYVTTPATGAAKIDVGTTTVSISTASDNLLDGIDVHAATGAFGLADGDGTNGKEDQVWSSGKWVTVKEISGDVTGLVGKIVIFYIIPA
jgi:hypothetical protein